MLIKLSTGIVGNGVMFEPGDVVDWQSDADCERLIKRDMAKRATPAEIKAAEGKVKTYCPPAPRPEDAWPPGRPKPLKAHDAD